MITQEYLKAVLVRETLSEDSDEIKAIRTERKNIEKLLRKSFEDSSLTIQYRSFRNE